MRERKRKSFETKENKGKQKMKGNEKKKYSKSKKSEFIRIYNY